MTDWADILIMVGFTGVVLIIGFIVSIKKEGEKMREKENDNENSGEK